MSDRHSTLPSLAIRRPIGTLSLAAVVIVLGVLHTFEVKLGFADDKLDDGRRDRDAGTKPSLPGKKPD